MGHVLHLMIKKGLVSLKGWREKEWEMEPGVAEPDVSVRMWKLKTDQKDVMLWAVLIYLTLKVNISE